MASEESPLLEAWNRLPAPEAEKAILPCNGSRAWAEALAGARPFPAPGALLVAADELWRGLPREAWGEAFASHPRIGGRHAPSATARSLAWSSGEQSAAEGDGTLAAALAAANREYKARFGRVFLVCATGKSATQILQILKSRLGNDAAAEWREAGEQQRRITQLRLRKWLGLPAAGCEDV